MPHLSTSRIWTLLAPNTQTRMSHAGAAVMRIAVGSFLAALHGWHKLVEGFAYVQSGAAWPLLDDVHVLALAFRVAGALAATFMQLLGGLAAAAGLLALYGGGWYSADAWLFGRRSA